MNDAKQKPQISLLSIELVTLRPLKSSFLDLGKETHSRKDRKNGPSEYAYIYRLSAKLR
jgi:hypothetical protein